MRRRRPNFPKKERTVLSPRLPPNLRSIFGEEDTDRDTQTNGDSDSESSVSLTSSGESSSSSSSSASSGSSCAEQKAKRLKIANNPRTSDRISTEVKTGVKSLRPSVNNFDMLSSDKSKASYSNSSSSNAVRNSTSAKIDRQAATGLNTGMESYQF